MSPPMHMPPLLRAFARWQDGPLPRDLPYLDIHILHTPENPGIIIQYYIFRCYKLGMRKISIGSPVEKALTHHTLACITSHVLYVSAAGGLGGGARRAPVPHIVIGEHVDLLTHINPLLQRTAHSNHHLL